MRKTFVSTALLLSVGAAALGLLLFPQEISQTVSSTLTICTGTLLPTLFPFLILSGFLIKSGLTAQIGRILEPLMRPLFHLPGTCASALLLGMIGGYPTGAKSVVSLYQDGLCSREEAEHALVFCNNCGPGFLLGSIGHGVFGNLSCGILLWGCHILSAVLTGMIFADPQNSPIGPTQKRSRTYVPSPCAALVSSVTDGMQAFLNLSAFVLCFSALTCLIRLSGITDIFTLLLPCSGENGSFFFLGLLEMTAGTLNVTSGSTPERLILISTLVGWGGLCVHFQVLSLIQHTDLSPGPYFFGKGLHGILAGALTACFLLGGLQFTLLVFLIVCTIVYFRKKSVEKKRNIYYNGFQEAN